MSVNDILGVTPEIDLEKMLRYHMIDIEDRLEAAKEDLVEVEAILVLLNENGLNNITVDTILKRKRDRLRAVKTVFEDDISRYEQQIKDLEEQNNAET